MRARNPRRVSAVASSFVPSSRVSPRRASRSNPRAAARLRPVVLELEDRVVLAQFTGDTTNWMSLINDGVALNQLSIPGTHDSMTYGSYAIGFPITQCQTEDLGTQLNHGVRYIDIRVASGGDYTVGPLDLECVHGKVELHMSFNNDVVAPVEQWLRLHPTETIIMQIFNDQGTYGTARYASTQQVEDVVEAHVNHNSYFGDDAYWYTGNTTPLLGNVRGKIVIINRWWDNVSATHIGLNENVNHTRDDSTSDGSPGVGDLQVAISREVSRIQSHLALAESAPTTSGTWFTTATAATASDVTQLLNDFSPTNFALDEPLNNGSGILSRIEPMLRSAAGHLGLLMLDFAGPDSGYEIYRDIIGANFNPYTLYWDPNHTGTKDSQGAVAGTSGDGFWDSTSSNWFNGFGWMTWDDSRGDSAVFLNQPNHSTPNIYCLIDVHANALFFGSGASYYFSGPGWFRLTGGIQADGGADVHIVNDFDQRGGQGFQVNGDGSVELSGSLFGDKSFILDRNNNGTLTLDGSSDNPNLVLSVNSGSVNLGKASTATVHAAAALSLNGGTARLTGSSDYQLFHATNQYLRGGLLDLNGKNLYIDDAHALIAENNSTIRNSDASHPALVNLRLKVSDGVQLIVDGGTFNAPKPIDLGSSSRMVVYGTMNADGAISPGGNADIAVDGTGTLNSTRWIAGTSPFNVDVYGGILTLGGSSDNANLSLHVLGGTTYLQKASTATGHAAALLRLDGGTVQLNGSNDYQLGYATDQTMTGGTLDFNGKNLYIDPFHKLNLSGGTLTNSSAGSFPLMNFSVALTNAATFSGVGDLSLAGIVQGTGSLIKTGTGRLELTGANSYSGGTTLSQGTLLVGNRTSLGTGNVTINDGGTGTASTSLLVEISASEISPISNDVVVAALGSGKTTIGTTNFTVSPSGTSSTVFAGKLTLNKGVTLRGGNSDRTTFSGLISGSADAIVIDGGARTTISNTGNTLVGSGPNQTLSLSIVNGSTLQVGSGGSDVGTSIPRTASVSVNGGSTFQIFGTGATIDGLSGSGVVRNIASSSTLLTVGFAGGDGSFGGTIQESSGGFGLKKIGAGTQTLTASQSYGQGTTVAGGTLVADGSLGNVVVNSGATFGGTGTVGALTVSGVVKPGDPVGSAGLLTAASADFSAGGTVSIAIASLSSFSKLRVNGDLKLGGTSSLNTEINGPQSGGTAATGIISYGGLSNGSFATTTAAGNTSRPPRIVNDTTNRHYNVQFLNKPTLGVIDGGGTYAGQSVSFPATVTVEGSPSLEGVTPTVTYYNGTYSIGTLPSSGGSSSAPRNVGNYTVAATFPGSTNYGPATALTNFSITPKSLFLTGITAADKVADETATAVLSGTASLLASIPSGQGSATDGRPYAGDPVFVGGNLAGRFTSLQTGVLTVVEITGGVLNNPNYSLSSPDQAAGTVKAVIRLRTAVTVTNAGGTYSGQSVSFPATAAVNGSASLDGTAPTFTYYFGTYNISNLPATGGSTTAPSNVGSYTVLATFPQTLQYTSSQAVTTFTIRPKTLLVGGLVALDKTYDGATAATLSGSAALLAAEASAPGTSGDGRPYTGDAASLGVSDPRSYIANFVSPEPGSGIVVKVVGGTLNNGNYVLASPDQAGGTVKASILRVTPTLSATDDSTTYDGLPHPFPAADVSVVAPPGMSAADGTLSFTYDGSSTVPTSAGRYSVVATFTPNDSTHHQAATTSATWVVQAARLTVTANGSATYGDASATLGYTAAGFVGSDTPAVLGGTPSYATSYHQGDHAGTTETVQVGGLIASNYDIAYVAGGFEVSKASLTIRPDDQRMIVGGTLPPFTFGYVGLVNGDTPAALTRPPTASTSAVASSPVGAYPIVASGAASSDYAITYASGQFSIYAAPTSRVNTGLTVSSLRIISGSVAASQAGPNAPGIGSLAVYVAVDSSGFPALPFTVLSPGITTFTYQCVLGHNYYFLSTAVDTLGHAESKPVTTEAAIYVAVPPPISSVTTAAADPGTGAIAVSISGTDAYGPGLATFAVYVRVDNHDGNGFGAPRLIQVIPAGPFDGSGVYSATLTYQAATDGVARDYAFTSVGTDTAGRVESAHGSADAVVRDVAVNAPFRFSGLTIQRGAIERSFIEFVGLTFNQGGAALTNLFNAIKANPSSYLRLLLRPSGTTVNQSVSLSGASLSLNAVDRVIELDFGSNGLGGSARNGSTLLSFWNALAAGDGWYDLAVDLSGTSSFGAAPHGSFSRLLGDVNGDGSVDSTDTYLVGKSKKRKAGVNPFA